MVWGWSNLWLISRSSAVRSNHTVMLLLLLKNNNLQIQSGYLFRYISKKDALLHKRDCNGVFHDVIFPFMRILSLLPFLVSIFKCLIRPFEKYRLSHLSKNKESGAIFRRKSSFDHIVLSDWNRKISVPVMPSNSNCRCKITSMKKAWVSTVRWESKTDK